MLNEGASRLFEWTVYPAQVFTRSCSKWYAERTYQLTPECVEAAAPRVIAVLRVLAEPTVTRFAGKVASPQWPPENTDPCPVPRCKACRRPLFQPHICLRKGGV